ncbi:hypothetical protein KC340_g706 [Hortaea werneckii]|nr:hypothetical protein KC342_g364 [Hortaea werneckii]KAI7339180.1 hypothetical protein KC340_g706 [Hortaea werneckii]KAI7391138.1 hypothetical protein KC328_g7628 [Hortaea werneckii]
MNILADEGSSMEQQKSTDVLLMELMGLALGWEFEGASEHRALVQRLYQAAQEERKATHTRFLHLQERQALCEKEVDSVRAKLADMEAATKDSQHAETGKKTLKEMEGEHSGRRDLKELGPRQRLQGTGVASVPSDSANNSIDVESPSVESSDPRKRQKTGQATSESLPPPPASPPPTVSSATQAQTLATSRKPSMAPMNSELRKNASMPKADCYRPTSATPTGLDPKLRKQRKPSSRFGRKYDAVFVTEMMNVALDGKLQRLVQNSGPRFDVSANQPDANVDI